jgi:RNA recognition motif-containing protein
MLADVAAMDFRNAPAGGVFSFERRPAFWYTCGNDAKEVRMNIYVGNLSYDMSEEDLRKEFEAFGKVDSVNIIKDKFTDRSRGFAFVEMAVSEEGKAAVAAINGKEVKGRALNVSEARPKTDSRRGGGGGGGGRRDRGDRW